jgi:hypothetical protein
MVRRARSSCAPNSIYSTHVVISCFVCRVSRHYLAEFCIVFDCNYPTQVAISCLSAGGPGTTWQSSVLSLTVIIPPTWQSAVLSAGGPGTTWQSSLLSLIVFIPPTWQSAVLSTGGSGTYQAEFCIVFACIYSTHVQSAVLSAGDPGTTWQSSVLYLFHPRGNQLFCLQVVPAPTWQSSLLFLFHPRGNQMFVCRWSRHLPGRADGHAHHPGDAGRSYAQHNGTDGQPLQPVLPTGSQQQDGGCYQLLSTLRQVFFQ